MRKYEIMSGGGLSKASPGLSVVVAGRWMLRPGMLGKMLARGDSFALRFRSSACRPK